MPIGFKNRTDGNVQVAVDAVRAAAVPHAFAGVDDEGTPAILHTRGNPDGHVILRGGRGAQNHGPDGVEQALEKLRAAGLPERVVVDASHDNSGKDAEPPARGRGRDRAPARGRPAGHRRRDARVVPGRRPPGPGARQAADLRPVDHRRLHGLGHHRRRARRRWRPPSGRGARPLPRPDADRGPGRRPDRRLDRPGGAPEAGRRRGRGPRPLGRAAGAGAGRRGHRPRGGLAGRGAGGRRRLLLLRARRRPDRPGARRAGGGARGLRGHRRRLGQADAGGDHRGRAVRGRPPDRRRRDLRRRARPPRPVRGRALVPDAHRRLVGRALRAPAPPDRGPGGPAGGHRRHHPRQPPGRGQPPAARAGQRAGGPGHLAQRAAPDRAELPRRHPRGRRQHRHLDRHLPGQPCGHRGGDRRHRRAPAGGGRRPARRGRRRAGLLERGGAGRPPAAAGRRAERGARVRAAA